VKKIAYFRKLTTSSFVFVGPTVKHPRTKRNQVERKRIANDHAAFKPLAKRNQVER
jgi:hypothetical protein